MCALSLYYAFEVTAGTFGLLGWTSDFYDQLTEGFRAGHLHIKALPSPELLARANPYSYESDKDWDAWMWDMSLYKGRYYIYWGPVPALMLWGIKAALGYSATVHDQWLVLFFSLTRLYAGSALIVRFARDQNPQLPRWALYLALLVFALASPTPYFLARPLVYEASIACGQGFLCLGLYFAYLGLREPRAQTRWFVAAGSCLGCALAARASLILSAPLVVVATAVCAARPRGYAWRTLLRALTAIGAPVAVSLFLYGLYNQLRFDAFYEFGLKYQLTGRPFETAARYFLPNMASYFGAAISWSCKFPFVRLPEHRQLSALIEWPPDYDIGAAENGERVGGVLVATTICWLWSIWFWRALTWARRKYKQRIAAATVSNRELWLILCAGAAIASGAPASRLYLASMRYLEDAASGMLLGAIAAGFWLLRPRPLAGRPRRLLGPVLYSSLALHTVFVGICLGFTGYGDSFRKENTALFRQLERTLSVCEIKRKLLHTVQPSEHGAIYVAWRDATHFESRNTCTQRAPARP